MLSMMFGQVAQDPNIQAQLDPNQLGLLNNLITGLAQDGGPNHYDGGQEFYIEEDEDHDEDEDVILLSNDPIPKEIGVKKGNKLFNAIPDSKLKEMQDDDDIIDYFLDN